MHSKWVTQVKKIGIPQIKNVHLENGTFTKTNDKQMDRNRRQCFQQSSEICTIIQMEVKVDLRHKISVWVCKIGLKWISQGEHGWNFSVTVQMKH